MQKWLISADTKKWDINEYYEKYGYVDWQLRFHYDIGDLIYIYCKKPVGKIMFKAFVEREEVIDKDTGEKLAILKFIEKVDTDELSYENLKMHGLKMAPMGGMKLKGDLENYVRRYFSNESKMWLIQAGVDSVKIDTFKDNNFVAIGWQLDDVSNNNFEEIKSLYNNVYPNESSQKIAADVTQINIFVNHITIGDYIVTSDSTKREYLLGICKSDYYFSQEKDGSGKDIPFNHCHDVEWLCSIKWEDISNETKKSFFPKSVLEINNHAKEEFLKYFKPISFSNEEKRNKIYFGAPGTGKSFNLNENKNKLLKNCNDNYERVTFHPDYTYANFVGTYKPVPKIDDDGNNLDDLTYEYVPGPFMRTLVKALKNPNEPFLLIIEEINRANVAAVFGDVFQLLDRDEDYKSEYPINASEDLKNYLKKELDINKMQNECQIKKYYNELLGKEYSQITIPSNMFIWATMNSADQGVFPMDTAFKRRWDFEYLGIDDGESKINNLIVKINDEEILWNDIRKAINHKLITFNINEDKLMGPFFAFKNYIKETNELIEIPQDIFNDVFMNKIVMYLFEDAARSKRDYLFKIDDGTTPNITYSQIRSAFDKKGIKIFSDDVIDEIFNINND